MSTNLEFEQVDRGKSVSFSKNEETNNLFINIKGIIGDENFAIKPDECGCFEMLLDLNRNQVKLLKFYLDSLF